MRISKTLQGKRFGRLVVTSERSVKTAGMHRYICLVACDCGKQKEVDRSNLKYGKTRSCGCLKLEELKKRCITHGKTKSPEYRAWCKMRDRCLNPKNKNWDRYGGRKIAVSERWLQFEAFLSDMGNKPRGFSLDRIDNEKGYSKNNCRWASPKTQCRNRTNNVIISAFGRSRTLAEWSEKLNINYFTLHKRYRRGVAPKEILKEPKR